MSKRTIPNVFIIESLDWEEEEDRREGLVIEQVLASVAKTSRYLYLRTRKELEHAVDPGRSILQVSSTLTIAVQRHSPGASSVAFRAFSMAGKIVESGPRGKSGYGLPSNFDGMWRSRDERWAGLLFRCAWPDVRQEGVERRAAEPRPSGLSSIPSRRGIRPTTSRVPSTGRTGSRTAPRA